jgi:hypothetical protein
MSELTKVIIDCATGQQTVVPLTAQEIAERDQMAAAAAEEQEAREAAATATAALKESAKAKLIAGEPLTAEEAAVLVI